MIVPSNNTPNSRHHGFSLRRSLEDQGLTLEADIRWHLQNMIDQAKADPSFDITSYRAGIVIAH